MVSCLRQSRITGNLKPARATAFIAIVLLHGLALYVFANGIVRSGARYESTVLQTRLLPSNIPREAPPPPVIGAVWDSPPLNLVTPEFTIALPVDPPQPPIQDHIDRQDTDEKSVPDSLPEGPSGSMTMPRPITRPHGSDRYPRESFLAKETGRTTIRICISATGAVDSVEVATTSGYPRLDRAAVGIGLDYRFKPAMLRGKAVPVCLPYGIKFGINNL
jgi:periplasmic protein TonB